MTYDAISAGLTPLKLPGASRLGSWPPPPSCWLLLVGYFLLVKPASTGRVTPVT
jgi:hypothetical protein